MSLFFAKSVVSSSVAFAANEARMSAARAQSEDFMIVFMAVFMSVFMLTFPV